MLNFALFGAGRIGQMHADNLAANASVSLKYVYDVNVSAASETADKHNAVAASDIDQILSDEQVDAVLIASSTDTHVDLITASAKAGKAVLCEKPIDLDIERVNRCRDEIENCNVAVQIGFNRRYDPSHCAVAEAVRAGEIGAPELIVITSRDPSPPPLSYIEVSGGLFRDMMIHDFDLARFVFGADEPVEVFAMASNLVDPAIGAAGDIDTAMVTLRTASGALCHINNSRRAVYGYDQRLEVFGDNGMIRSNNRRPHTVSRHHASATGIQAPLLNFFIERYQEAYNAEINDFVEAVESQRTPAVTFEDGRRALIIADAAYASLASGQKVEIRY